MHVLSGNVAERASQPPLVSVSTIVLALRPPEGATVPADGSAPWIPLVQRNRPPFEGAWAIPGDVLTATQSLRDVAREALDSVTGTADGHLEQLHTFGEVGRSGRDRRHVTVTYWAMLAPSAASAGAIEGVAWFPLRDLPELAFDHGMIIGHAVNRLAASATIDELAPHLLDGEFTLAELRAVHESLMGHALDPANFRRRMLATGTLAPTGTRRGGAHRPAATYRFIDPSEQGGLP